MTKMTNIRHPKNNTGTPSLAPTATGKSIRRAALFLDRDGIINEDRGYVHTAETFVWCDGIFELVRSAVAFGFLPVVVTNQSGIGRGYYTEQAFAELTGWMRARFADEEAPIAAVYHCPFHPDATVAEYRQDHPWRKPAPGMLLAAAQDLDLNLTGSILVGDTWSDIAAASAAGVARTVLIGGREVPLTRPHPTQRSETLRGALGWLETQMRDHSK
jgi:D-glycero-D-manno-heptose 1,7-bisphosphate phosphatase